jgi:hypothetical protein
MRLVVIALCCCAWLTAVDTGPHCTGDVLGEAWLPNLPRSAVRWNAGPYPVLVAQPWAKALVSKLQPMWSHMKIDSRQVLNALADSHHGRCTVSSTDDAEAPPLMQLDIGLRERPTSNAFIRLVQDHLPVATRLSNDGPPAWLSGTAEAVLFDQRPPLRSTLKPGPIRIPEPFLMPDSSVDLALAAKPEVIPKLVSLIDVPHDTLLQTGYGEQRIHFTLEPFGLREHSEQDLAPERVAMLSNLQLPVVKRSLFDALPADTLFAIVTGSDSATTTELFAALKTDDGKEFDTLNAALDRIGLPDCCTLARALDGDVVVWVEPGSPFPIASLTADMNEATGRKILESLHTHAGLTLTDDGSVTGMASLVTLNARWRDGVLAMTTDPLGLDAALGRRGGFTEHPEVQAALAEIAKDAQFAAVSRSAPSWEALGRLSLLGLTALKLPGIHSMPHDLAVAARFGFLSYTVRDGVIILDAGGLFGGPITWIGLIGTGTFSYWCSFMERAQPPEAVEADADDVELK